MFIYAALSFALRCWGEKSFAPTVACAARVIGHCASLSLRASRVISLRCHYALRAIPTLSSQLSVLSSQFSALSSQLSVPSSLKSLTSLKSLSLCASRVSTRGPTNLHICTLINLHIFHGFAPSVTYLRPTYAFSFPLTPCVFRAFAPYSSSLLPSYSNNASGQVFNTWSASCGVVKR